MVTNEWLDEEAAGWEESSGDGHAGAARDAELASALRELIARRAADEGAVVVEGWVVDSLFFTNIEVRWYGKSGSLRIFRTGGIADVPVTVTIRRRSAEPAGGEG